VELVVCEIPARVFKFPSLVEIGRSVGRTPGVESEEHIVDDITGFRVEAVEELGSPFSVRELV
jgi:hypothetical protein